MSKARKGKKHTNETKRKISITHQKSGRYNGKNNPNYNHNLTENDRIISKNRNHISGYGRFKKEVLKRDNYTCQKCGSHEHLQVHHINNFKDFKEQRTELNNGVTLCKNCHESNLNKGIHNLYGRYPTKNQFDIFMNNYHHA
jgi:5-methylcytosine-specific restriction endonuclease McrA